MENSRLKIFSVVFKVMHFSKIHGSVKELFDYELITVICKNLASARKWIRILQNILNFSNFYGFSNMTEN